MNSLHLELSLGVLGLVLLLVESFATIPRRYLAYTAISGLVLAFVLLCAGSGNTVVPGYLTEFYVIDNLAIFYKGFAILSTLAVTILAVEYAPVIHKFVAPDNARTKEAGMGEFYSLPLFVCVGLMIMASAVDLITIFVALELTTITFYVLVAFMRRSAMSLEAGVKYLILGALSTGLLVYGLAWIYGLTGELTLAGISHKLSTWEGSNVPLLFAAALVLGGLGFKVAAVPFHIWVPDVYQGAPTPITAFLSVGSKASGFIVMTRVVDAFLSEGSVIAAPVIHLLLIIGGATVLFGNLAAIAQTNFKRLLGYSSVAHAGFLVIALACRHAVNGFSPAEIVAFYLATYLPMTFLCFLFLSAARAQGINEEISSFKGLARSNPLLGFALTLALASLAGLPLTAGFMGKLLVIFSAAYDGSYIALSLAIIGAAVGFYYYFKVILSLYSEPEGEPRKIKLNGLSKVLAAVLVAAIVVIGVYPDSVRKALKPTAEAVAVTH